ncbi:hypothetical protein K501DRAFT_272895 [Backusella circina FSU 941]|nr:hypothetical protein K501DRAFT_272895 [Backusella circina FSU 941]
MTLSEIRMPSPPFGHPAMRCEKKKNTKLYKKEKLKEAKNEYEERIEEYFQQLTVGCGQKECKNRFCASGRGSILNLQPQAALIMAIQLASMPDSRRCLVPNQTLESTKENNDVKPPFQANNKQQQQQQQTKPFLQSLFNATPFSVLLEPKKKKVETSTSTATTTDWTSDFWKLFNPFQHKHSKEQDKTDQDADYYQIDSDHSSIDSKPHHESDASSFSDTAGMLLAIAPITVVNLDQALEELKQENEKWCRSLFQSWEGIGNSFISKTVQQELGHEKYHLIDLNQLKQFMMVINNMESVSDSFETLLDRMCMNVDSLAEIDVLEDAETDHIRIIIEWCRSIVAVIQWVLCCKEQRHKKDEEQLLDFNLLYSTANNNKENPKVTLNKPTQEDKATESVQKRTSTIASTSQLILTQKLVHVLSKIAQNKKSLVRKVMQNMFSSLDATRMTLLVHDLHQYLLDHFHTGPYKHGVEDTVIMTLKCLELIYQASMKRPNEPILPPETFYNTTICKKLNIKNEYRIWKRVLMYGEGRHSTWISRQGETENQRRFRLFMTTSSTLLPPYPFENEFQFSWFGYPFLLPPSIKRKIVLMDAMSQMSLEYEDACVNHTLVVHAQKLLSEAPRMLQSLETNLRSATCPYLLLEIRREHFISDTLSQMSRKWADIKKPLKVKFIEGGEEGMDQGGVQKEFFGVLFEKLIADQIGLFSEDASTRLCWIRPVSDYDTRMYEMVGLLMGLSIYNGVIMNLQFPKILWKVLVMPNEAIIDAMAERHQLFTLQDLEEGWPDLGHGLRQLLEWDSTNGDVEDIFCRDYDISLDIFGKGVITKSLMKREDDPVVPVTNTNREEYVKDYCTYFMYTAQREQILALRRGMRSVIGSKALNLCTAEELEMVVCGLRQGPDSVELDMTELESVAEYDDGYSADHVTILQFWSVVHNDLTIDQKRKLLLFVTASDRVPVGGLKELTFYVQRNGPDSDRLPTALTCFSRLLLPEYSSKQKLRDRLVTAIENAKGFGLV